MTNTIKHKRSIGNRLKDAMNSLKQISSAVLQHNDVDHQVDDLFNSSESDKETDYIEVLKKESQNLLNIKILKNTTPTDTPYTANGGTFTSPNSVKSSETVHSDIKNDNISISNNIKSLTSASLPPPPPPPTGAEMWEINRSEWLKPTIPVNQLTKRKNDKHLAEIAQTNDEVYLNVYKNLIVYGKPLKKGINLSEAIKCIYIGWDNDNMFERVKNGGIP